MHYENALDALNADKHVLCEKAFTVNAAQVEELVQVSREKGLFLMEAVWTRFFPMSGQIRELLKKGEIGQVLRTSADLSIGEDVEGRPL